jgi:RHS repeat-associated protein
MKNKVKKIFNLSRALLFSVSLLLVPSALSATEKIYFFHNDHLGTPQEITDIDQNIVWQAGIDPFGGASPRIEQVVNNIRFPGQYYDEESGLHYNWNRYYDPEIGRYITSDPIGLAGGLNTYSYAYQNPNVFTDPTGEFVPLAYLGALWVGAEIGLTAYDVYETGKVFLDPCSSWGRRSLAAGTLLAGLVLPGSYGWLDNLGGAPKETRTLFHYTDDVGLNGILSSKKLNPSLKANNPKDARFGDGQYLSDIAPGTRTGPELSSDFLGIPFQGRKFKNFVEIDVTDLNVVKGRDGVFVVPNNAPLDLSRRIVNSGSN